MSRPDDAPNAAAERPLWLRLLRLEPLDAVVDTLRRWLVWAIVIAVGPGLAIWAPLHRDDPKFVLDDVGQHLIKFDLPLAERLDIIRHAALSLLVMAVVYALLGWRHRRRGDGSPLADYFARLNVKLLPLALLPLVSALFTEQLETRLQLLTLAFATILAVLLGFWFYRVVSERAVAMRERLRALERRGMPELLMMLLVLAYTMAFGYLSVTDHKNLGTHIYDLALYDNTFWNTVHGNSMACSYLRGGTHYSAHFDPIIIVLSPIYALNPRAETLLWLQSAWLAMGGVPLYLHAKRTLGNPWQALAVMLLFFLAPALHGINMFDFHSLALMVPLVMWMVYLLDVGSTRALVGYWACLALLLLAREDMPFVACSISIYAIATRRRLTGVLTIVAAIAYLVEIKSGSRALLAGDKESYSYSYYYEEMIPKGKDGDEGLVGLLTTTLSDPAAVLAVLLKPQKLIYFGKVLLPLLMLPFFSGSKRLLLLYGMAFIGLVSRKYVFSVHFQYSAVLLPFLLMAWPDGLAGVTRGRWIERLGIDPQRLRATLVFSALVATLAVSAKFGALVPNREFHAGWNRLHHTHNKERAERYENLMRFVEQVPPEASICTNSVVGPHVSNRPVALKWPSCRDAEYVLMDNAGKLKKKDQRRLDRLKARSDYEVIDEDEEWLLLRKLGEDEVAERKRSQPRPAKESKRDAAKRPRKPTGEDDEGDDALPTEDDDNPYRPVVDKDKAKPEPEPEPERGRNDEDEEP